MSRSRFFAALLLATALVALGFPSISGPEASFAAQPRVAASPTAPIAGEAVRLTGRFSTRLQRPAKLQYRDGARWVTLSSKATTRSGGYAFATRTTAARVYRISAPAYHGHAAVTSPAKRLSPATQSGFISVLPQIAQAGRYSSSSANANYPMSATFRPARPGRTILFQRQSGTSWVTVHKAPENQSGTATYAGTHTAGLYRAVAARSHGAPAQYTSLPVSTDAWHPVFDSEFDGPTLDPQWTYQEEGIYQPKSGRKCSTSSRKAVIPTGSTLELRVALDPARRGQKCRTTANGRRYTFPYYINGHIATTFTFTHGVAAARVKFPKPKGEHGSFWMWSPRTEIDTVEYFGAPRKTSVHGDESRNIYQFIHSYSARGKLTSYGGFRRNSAALLPRNQQWYNRYHVFSVQWEANRYVFMVDGVKTFQTSRGVSSEPHVLLLSLLSSDWELPQMNNAALPTGMSVDWVKVWQQTSS